MECFSSLDMFCVVDFIQSTLKLLFIYNLAEITQWVVLCANVICMNIDLTQLSVLGCNSSFFSLIPKKESPTHIQDYRPISLIGRQILDGPLIINEVVDWCKRKKKKALFFKVDFDKAFDSIYWDYIFSMISFMGFDFKWIRWIKACLTSSYASLLLNGSPSFEFHIGRGLRQGDPLSPFLFIIGMEGLQAAISYACHSSIYSGLRIGGVNSDLRLSRCFFADDVLFVGEWNDNNARTLLAVLACFFAVSGLKINLSKSSVYGVGISTQESSRMAAIMGCAPCSLPFKFLGLPVGQNMNREVGWEYIIKKVQKRLSSWKVNLLSFGGRLTLIKSVMGSLGLSVPCLKSLNHALLYKWRWRFVSNQNSCWAKVISAIHGQSPNGHIPCASYASGTWSSINKCISSLHSVNVITPSSIRCKLGSGSSLDFWHDPWLDGTPLLNRYPRLFALESEKNGSVASHFGSNGWQWSWRRDIREGEEQSQYMDLSKALSDVSLSSDYDSWCWECSSDGLYSVSIARTRIQASNLAPFSLPTLWCKHVPIKINVFIWRLKMHRLATLRNLEARGLNFDNSCCGFCDVSEESHSHLFVRCDTTYQIWCRTGNWLGIAFPIWNSIDDIWPWIDSNFPNGKKRIIITVIAYSILWNIWRLRNCITFKDHTFNRSHVFDNIVLSSFNWLYARYHKSILNWTVWLQTPMYSL
ncbi:uncharacterized protein [Rutidosis leptorrhynchoides]|uniref:uncharacterized protein n=1 Tax=Rutidosis leptorrhynchoides TaxID=125765 RepID=UPI003A998FEF